MKLTDQQLEQAAKQMAKAIGNAPFSEEEQTFSPAFEEKMAQMLKKQRRGKYLRTFARSAAAVLLILTVGCGILLAFHAEARAAALSWYRKHTDGRYSYIFTENRSGETLPLYEIQALPEGYSLFQTSYNQNSCRIDYRKPRKDSNYIIPLSLEYTWISEDFSTMLAPSNTHDLTFTQVTVNGQPADLYLETSSANTYKTHRLLWVDEEAGLFFYLVTRLSAEETIAVAESVRPVK